MTERQSLSFARCSVSALFVRTSRSLVAAVLSLALLLMPSVAWGQATTSVRGTVTDPGGNAVVGATVVLANAESKTERTATTGGQGEYQFLFVPPGTYTLTVTAAGFRNYEQKGLVLLVNTPATANVQLKVGAAAELVTVTSEIPAIDLVDASLGNSFDERQVRQIPLEGRNVPDLLSLQAGVAYTGNRIADQDQDTRNGAVNGARSDQSNITLDGVDVNDQANGYAKHWVPLERSCPKTLGPFCTKGDHSRMAKSGKGRLSGRSKRHQSPQKMYASRVYWVSVGLQKPRALRRRRRGGEGPR